MFADDGNRGPYVSKRMLPARGHILANMTASATTTWTPEDSKTAKQKRDFKKIKPN